MYVDGPTNGALLAAQQSQGSRCAAVQTDRCRRNDLLMAARLPKINRSPKPLTLNPSTKHPEPYSQYAKVG
jgi:hypothetical protein